MAVWGFCCLVRVTLISVLVTLFWLSFSLLRCRVSSGLWGNGQNLGAALRDNDRYLAFLNTDIVALGAAPSGWGRGNIGEPLAEVFD